MAPDGLALAMLIAREAGKGTLGRGRVLREKEHGPGVGGSGWRTGQALAGNCRFRDAIHRLRLGGRRRKQPGWGDARALPVKTAAVILDDLVDLAEAVAGVE